MTVRSHLGQMLDNLPDAELAEVLEFARFLVWRKEQDQWRLAARCRFAEAYGPDEPEYTESMLKSRINP